MKYKTIFWTSVLIIAGLAWFYRATAENVKLPTDGGGSRNPVQGIMRPSRAVNVVLSDTASALSDSLQSPIVRLYCPNDVWFEVCTYTGTADSTDILLPGGIVEYFHVPQPYHYIAAKLKHGATVDTLRITEMQ